MLGRGWTEGAPPEDMVLDYMDDMGVTRSEALVQLTWDPSFDEVPDDFDPDGYEWPQPLAQRRVYEGGPPHTPRP